MGTPFGRCSPAPSRCTRREGCGRTRAPHWISTTTVPYTRGSSCRLGSMLRQQGTALCVSRRNPCCAPPSSSDCPARHSVVTDETAAGARQDGHILAAADVEIGALLSFDVPFVASAARRLCELLEAWLALVLSPREFGRRACGPSSPWSGTYGCSRECLQRAQYLRIALRFLGLAAAGAAKRGNLFGHCFPKKDF